jgi:hypothetical protein
VRDCNFDTDIRAPNNDYRRKRDDYVQPKAVHKAFEFFYDLSKASVQALVRR